MKTYHGGTGTFTADRSYDVPDFEGYAVVSVVDINGDGYPDLAGSAWYSYVTSFFLSGGGMSMLSVKHYLAPYPWDGGIVVGDFNNDGHADFVTVDGSTFPATIAVRLYRGCP